MGNTHENEAEKTLQATNPYASPEEINAAEQEQSTETVIRSPKKQRTLLRFFIGMFLPGLIAATAIAISKGLDHSFFSKYEMAKQRVVLVFILTLLFSIPGLFFSFVTESYIRKIKVTISYCVFAVLNALLCIMIFAWFTGIIPGAWRLFSYQTGLISGLVGALFTVLILKRIPDIYYDKYIPLSPNEYNTAESSAKPDFEFLQDVEIEERDLS